MRSILGNLLSIPSFTRTMVNQQTNAHFHTFAFFTSILSLAHFSLVCVKRTYFGASGAFLKDVYKNDRGVARRLTFQERAERRTGKTREQKENKMQLIHEAQLLVDNDFPEELESIYAKTFERANIIAMKVLNLAKCLELQEIEVSGGHSVLLTKVAQVVKVDANTLEIIPRSDSFSSNVLQRIGRFDSTLQVFKEGPKVKVLLPPITTARRDKAVEDIATLTNAFRQKARQARNNAGRILQDCGLQDGTLLQLREALDSTANSFVEAKVRELEALSQQVMTMGADESDVAVEQS